MTSPGYGRGFGLPITHYFVSISRGDAIRTAMLTPVAFWTLVALLPASLGFGLAGAFELASADRFPGVVASLIAKTDPNLQTEETEARDAAESDALEARLRGVVDREIGLEKHGLAIMRSEAEAT